MSFNPILKLWYKIFYKDKYQYLKYKKSLDKRIKYYNSSVYNKILQIHENIKNNKDISFLHSGHLGDIIYSLPTIKKLSENHNCNFYIQINKTMDLKYFNHPAGNFFLNEKLANMLLPLLREQNYLKKVEIYNGQNIEVDLDFFRKIPINIQFYSPRWFFLLTGVQTNLEKPYLEVKKHKEITNKIVIIRTFRARNHFINYKFLKNFNDLIFIGLPEEFEDLKKQIPNLEFYDCKDFLEMSEIIKASKFFIGNQGLGYALAEALKVPRLLEANPDFPVIFPIGPNSYDFYHQNDFEKFFNTLNKN
tara:strand:+ start:3611 stop:4525 length:915 start_codon:yes stop_codon:yes gene_type:complete